MSRTWRLDSRSLEESCGFQEMPGWSIDQVEEAHLRKDAVTLGTGWKTMNVSQRDGLSRIGNTVYTNSSLEHTTG